MTNQKIVFSLLFILILTAVGFSVYKSKQNQSSNTPANQPILNFEDCRRAGYPVMETYPAQCRTESGELFVQVVDQNPNTPPSKIAAGYVAGHVSIGPNCPGPERIDQPCKTPPEAYSSRQVIVYESDGATIREKGKIDTEGNYKIALAPGSYFIQISPAGIRPGEKKPVTVKSFETSVVDFDIDTGIR